MFKYLFCWFVLSITIIALVYGILVIISTELSTDESYFYLVALYYLIYLVITIVLVQLMFGVMVAIGCNLDMINYFTFFIFYKKKKNNQRFTYFNRRGLELVKQVGKRKVSVSYNKLYVLRVFRVYEDIYKRDIFK